MLKIFILYCNYHIILLKYLIVSLLLWLLNLSFFKIIFFLILSNFKKSKIYIELKFWINPKTIIKLISNFCEKIFFIFIIFIFFVQADSVKLKMVRILLFVFVYNYMKKFIKIYPIIYEFINETIKMIYKISFFYLVKNLIYLKF